MDILLVAATTQEIPFFLEYISDNYTRVDKNSYENEKHRISILISGVGMTATSYALAKALTEKNYNFVLQVGIAGSYNPSIELGTVCFVTSEIFGDLGAEDRHLFLDVFELNLQEENQFPFNAAKLINPQNLFADLLPVTALTVNTVAGSLFTIEKRKKKYGADIESMEGAALHYTCLKEKINFAQVRSISNYVEVRNRKTWKMKASIEQLNQWLINILNEPILK